MQGRLQNLLHSLTSGTAPFVDIRTGEMEDNPKAACVTGTNIWPDSFKFPPALMDSTSLVESEYILLHQSLHTLFYLSGKASDKADRRAVADQMIQHQQPPRGRDYSSFFDDYAGTAAHLRGMLPHDAMALGLPIWEKVPRKRKRARDVGDQNGSQVDSDDDVDLDAVALADNELCYVDSESDDDDCILVGQGWQCSRTRMYIVANGPVVLPMVAVPHRVHIPRVC